MKFWQRFNKNTFRGIAAALVVAAAVMGGTDAALAAGEPVTEEHEIIGLGSDFDGIGGKLELSDCSKMPLLADALRKEGFTEDEVEAIFFRNAQRFFENNL